MSANPETEASEPPATGAQPVTRRILRETSLFAALGVGSAVLAWGASLVLARLLERRDFGVFGICTFYIGLGTLLGNGGLGATLLRRPADGVTREEYQSTLTALLALAVALAGAVNLAAPWIAAENQLSPAETTVLRAMAPIYVLGALRVVPYVRMERQLMFSAIARIELVSGVVRHVLSIALAFAGGSVWALVLSQLAGAFVQLVLSYRVSPGWVGLGWSWRVFRPLIAYGSKVQLLAIAAHLKDNGSRALLGSGPGPVAVGVFDFGVSYIQTPVTAVNGLARVQLPIYARFEARDPALHATLRGAMRTALLVGVPLLGLLALLSPWLIPLIYGQKWAAAYPVVWGLLPNMVCGLLVSPLFTLLQGQGRAGLAIVVFGGWTTFTWLLALAALVVVPQGLASLAPIAAGYSVATIVVTIYLFSWARGHLGRSAAEGLGAPLASGVVGLAASGALFTWGTGWAAHPVTLAVVFLAGYAGALAVREGRVVAAEARTLFSTLRGKTGDAA